MPSSASAAFRSKYMYGKYLPHQRFNVDQVPLPFINGMDETYEEVGAKRVAVNQNGPQRCCWSRCVNGTLWVS